MTFVLEEYTRSDTATRLGILNIPTEKEIANLKIWHEKIRVPLENRLATKIFITSAFRCLELNRALKSGDNSQHVTGHAVDFIVYGYTTFDLYEFIRQKTELPYDQLICEYPQKGGWVHLSYSDKHRKQAFVIS